MDAGTDFSQQIYKVGPSLSLVNKNGCGGGNLRSLAILLYSNHISIITAPATVR